MKAKTLRIPFSDAEKKRIEELAAESHLKISALLRMYLSQEMEKFQKNNQFGIHLNFDVKLPEQKENYLYIYVPEQLNQTLEEYCQAIDAKKKLLVRYLIVPRLTERW